MTGTLNTLDDHLFAQLTRMAKTDMTAAQLEAEVARTDAIVALADQVVQNSRTKILAAKLFAEHGKPILPHLPMIGMIGPIIEKDSA